MTGSGSVNRLDGDTISIEFPISDSQNSTSDEIDILEVVEKAHQFSFDTLSNINTSAETNFNKTSKIVSGVS